MVNFESDQYSLTREMSSQRLTQPAGRRFPRARTGPLDGYQCSLVAALDGFRYPLDVSLWNSARFRFEPSPKRTTTLRSKLCLAPSTREREYPGR